MLASSCFQGGKSPKFIYEFTTQSSLTLIRKQQSFLNNNSACKKKIRTKRNKTGNRKGKKRKGKERKEKSNFITTTLVNDFGGGQNEMRWDTGSLLRANVLNLGQWQGSVGLEPMAKSENLSFQMKERTDSCNLAFDLHADIMADTLLLPPK